MGGSRSSPTNDANVVVRFLKKYIVMRFGTPGAIISDERTYFYNNSFKTLAKKYRVKHKIAMVYHPQTNE